MKNNVLGECEWHQDGKEISVSVHKGQEWELVMVKRRRVNEENISMMS